MKFAHAVLLGVVSAQHQPVKVDTTKMVDIVEGFLNGVFQAEGFTDIKKCVTDVEGVLTDADEAVVDFEQKNISGIAAGLKKLGDLALVVKSGMQDCSHLSTDWNKLETIAKAFTSPKSIAMHIGKDILINGKDIYHEVDTAVGDYKGQNWKDFGTQVGEASAKIILGAEPPKQKPVKFDTVKMVAIVEGFLQGVFQAEGFTEIEKCVTDGEGLLTDVDVAYNDFKEENISGIAAGLKKLGDAALVVKSGMQDCSHVQEDWTKLETIAKAFSSPTSIAWHLGKDLLVNGKDIYSEINTAVGDYDSQNWKDFGIQVGEASAKIILGEEPPMDFPYDSDWAPGDPEFEDPMFLQGP